MSTICCYGKRDSQGSCHDTAIMRAMNQGPCVTRNRFLRDPRQDASEKCLNRLAISGSYFLYLVHNTLMAREGAYGI